MEKMRWKIELVKSDLQNFLMNIPCWTKKGDLSLDNGRLDQLRLIVIKNYYIDIISIIWYTQTAALKSIASSDQCLFALIYDLSRKILEYMFWVKMKVQFQRTVQMRYIQTRRLNKFKGWFQYLVLGTRS